MLKKILAILSSLILAGSVGILIYYIIGLKDIENFLRYAGSVFIFLITMLIICLTLIYSLKKTKKSIIGFILLILISLGISAGVNFINYNLMVINKALSSITSKLETVSVSLVSLDEKGKANDIKNEKIAILKEETSKNINTLSIELKESLKYGNEIVTYDDIYQIADDMQNETIKYAILPANYGEMYLLYDEYIDFSDKLNVILNKEKNQEVEDETVKKDINEPFSMLLMGVDTLSSSYNADTLLVVTFNPETLTATTLSIPRDTYTTLANGAKHKINASGWSGDKSVVKTVSKYLGINIDYYVKINFVGAVQLIDALGGIEVDVPYSFCEQNSKRKWGSNTVYVDKGFQKLNGEQALALSRNRHYWSGRCNKKYTTEGTRNDFTRGQNQQLVFKGILNQLKNIDSLDTLYGILDTLGKNINTNMSRDTILSFYNLGKEILKKVEGQELSDALTIQKLFFTSYIQTIRIGNMNLSTVGHYGGSVDAIKSALKENLGLKEKESIKKMSFNINNPYKETVIGKNIYTNKNAPKLMENFEKKDISVLQKWAANNGYTVQIEEKEITDGSYVNNAIIYQSPKFKVDLSTVSKTIKVTVAKVSNVVEVFKYSQCLTEEKKSDSRCILGDYTNQSLNTFKSFVTKTGLNLKVNYKEVEGTADKIVSQSVKNKSLYDIINNNLTIDIDYSTYKAPVEDNNNNNQEEDNTNNNNNNNTENKDDTTQNENNNQQENTPTPPPQEENNNDNNE